MLKLESPKHVAGINRLLRQLNPKALRVTKEALVEMLREKSWIKIAVILDKNKKNQILGVASLYIVRTFFGLKGIIENVVVDEEYRGKGYGKQLLNGLIDEAKKKGIVCLELTCGYRRHKAQKMYESLGFKKRETDAYRLELK